MPRGRPPKIPRPPPATAPPPPATATHPAVAVAAAAAAVAAAAGIEPVPPLLLTAPAPLPSSYCMVNTLSRDKALLEESWKQVWSVFIVFEYTNGVETAVLFVFLCMEAC